MDVAVIVVAVVVAAVDVVVLAFSYPKIIVVCERNLRYISNHAFCVGKRCFF